MRYKAWSELLYAWTTPQTTTPGYKLPIYTYTGQACYMMGDPTSSGVIEGFGLMFYNARWYDGYLNHMTQPDSIVPTSVQGVQAYDRYAHANNNPIRYTDPSGHFIWPSHVGTIITLNFALGINIGPLFWGYGSIRIATDNKGNIGLFATKRDQHFDPANGLDDASGCGCYVPGEAEEKNPTSQLALGGVSLTKGFIYGGEDWTINDLEGKGYDYNLGIGPAALGATTNISNTYIGIEGGYG